jgi:Flagellar basal body protein
MDVSQIGVLSLADRRMGYLAESQKVIAQNIANAHRPRYRAREVVPFSEVLARRVPSQPVRTNPMHLQGTRNVGTVPTVPVNGAEGTISGNNVSIEEEMVKAAQVKDQHALAASIYKKGISFIRLSVK